MTQRHLATTRSPALLWLMAQEVLEQGTLYCVALGNAV